MRYLPTILLLLTSPAWAADFMVTVPDSAVPDLQVVCDRLATLYSAKDPTNSECGAMLVRIGQERVARELVTRSAERTKRDTVNDRVAEVMTNFPSPLRDAVCGDSEVDDLAGEQCDDGGSNSDTVADACRLNCLDAHCGDGVVDTGEVCDGAGCLPDCSALE